MIRLAQSMADLQKFLLLHILLMSKGNLKLQEVIRKMVGVARGNFVCAKIRTMIMFISVLCLIENLPVVFNFILTLKVLGLFQ